MWANYLACLYYHVFICEEETITVPISLLWELNGHIHMRHRGHGSMPENHQSLGKMANSTASSRGSSARNFTVTGLAWSLSSPRNFPWPKFSAQFIPSRGKQSFLESEKFRGRFSGTSKLSCFSFKGKLLLQNHLSSGF